MIDLLRAFHFRRVVREVLVDGEVETKAPSLVHSFVGLNCQGKIEDVVGVGERGFHCASEGAFKFGEVWEGGEDQLRYLTE